MSLFHVIYKFVNQITKLDVFFYCNIGYTKKYDYQHTMMNKIENNRTLENACN